MILLNEALHWHSLGYKVIPVSCPSLPDGKRPLCSWKKYQESQTEEEVRTLFSSPKAKAIALLTGQGIEVIDIDAKYALDKDKFVREVFDAAFMAIDVDKYMALTKSRTVSGGYHLIYKTNVSEGNQKLASRYTTKEEQKTDKDTVRVLLETRGEGGYILIPSSQGYEWDNPNKTLDNLVTLTDDERNSLIAAMKAFEETREAFTRSKPKVEHHHKETLVGHKSTIDDYNEKTSVSDLLQEAGWRFMYHSNGNDMYRRPGKDSGCISAGVSLEMNLVRVFTTSTEFEGDRTYNPFQVYSILNHSGDYSRASKDLWKQGYGDRISKLEVSYNKKLEALRSESKIDQERATDKFEMQSLAEKFRFFKSRKPKQAEYNLWCQDIPIASFGDMVTVVGGAKSRKSALTAAITSSLLNPMGEEVLNFKGSLKGRKIVYLDTEQSEYDFYKSMNAIYKMANQAYLTDNHSQIEGYCLTEMPLTQRLEFIPYILKSHEDVGVLVIDGIVDICEDYNDQKQVRNLIDHLKTLLSKYNTMLISVLHNARSTGKARGHLGTELINKSKAVVGVAVEECAGDDGGTYSTCKFEYLRGSRSPKAFNFGHDDAGNLTDNPQLY